MLAQSGNFILPEVSIRLMPVISSVMHYDTDHHIVATLSRYAVDLQKRNGTLHNHATLSIREMLPAAHRATGYGLCVVLNRVGGISGVLIGSYANVETVTPLWVCAGLFGLLIVFSLMLPFESRGKRSV